MDDKQQGQTLHLKAHKAKERGDFLVALDYYIRAQQYDPGSTDLFMGRAFCLILLKRYEESAVLYEEAVKQRPERWTAHSGLGAALLRLRRYEEAVAALTRAIELNPDGGDIDSYLDLAFAYSSLQQHDDAAKVVEAATRLGLSHPRLDLQRGYIANAKGDLEGAFDHFRRAEASAPGDSDITHTVAKAAYHLKKYLIARDAFKRMLVQRPDWREALMGIYHSEAALSNMPEAFAALEKAYASEPEKLQAVLESKRRMLGGADTPKGSWSLKRREPPKY